MNKKNFLDDLRRALNSTHSPRLVEENISYYSSYIDEELAKGRTLEDIFEELGEPSLIARSIKDAAGISNNIDNKETYSEKSFYENSRQTYTDDFGNEIYNNKKNQKKYNIFNFNRLGFGIILIGIIVLAILIVVGIFMIFVGLVNLFAPIFIPLIVVYILYKLYMLYKK